MKKVLYILGQLSDEDVEWMITKGKKRNVPNGTVLIRERQPHDGFYIVLDGKLSVERGGETVAEIGVGEVVGEMSFVDSRPPTATVSSASRRGAVRARPRRARSSARARRCLRGPLLQGDRGVPVRPVQTGDRPGRATPMSSTSWI